MMLTVIRDECGRLQAACDWWLVNDTGQFDPRGGYVWVNQLELSPGAGSQEMIRAVIQHVAFAAPWAVGAYWERNDTTGHRLHAYRRDQLLCEEVRA